MTDAVIISLVVAACGAINAAVVFVTFWMQRGRHEGEVKTEAAQSSVLAAKALAHSESLASEVANWRVDTAQRIERVRTIAEMGMGNLTASETRLAKSLDDVGDRIDKLTVRFDRWLEAQANQGS